MMLMLATPRRGHPDFPGRPRISKTARATGLESDDDRSQINKPTVFEVLSVWVFIGLTGLL